MTFDLIVKNYIYIFMSIVVALIAMSGERMLGDNWVIPDSYNLFFIIKDSTSFSPVEIYEQHKTSVLFLFVSKVMHAIGLYSFFIANLAMVLYAFFRHSKERRFCFTFLILSPLFILNTPLPSKDIMVAFLFCMWIYAIYSNSSIKKTILLACIIFLVRDGFGIILVAISMVLKNNLANRVPVLLVFAAIFFAVIISDVLPNYASDFFLFQRVTDIAEKYGVVSFPMRLFGNITNFASRNPLLTNDGTLNVVFISYSVTGVTMLCTFLLSLKALKSKNLVDIKLSLCYFLLIIAFSISPLIQARYVAPLILIPTFYKSISKRDVIMSCIISFVFAVFLSMVYLIFDKYPVPSPVELYYNVTTYPS